MVPLIGPFAVLLFSTHNVYVTVCIEVFTVLPVVGVALFVRPFYNFILNGTVFILMR